MKAFSYRLTNPLDFLGNRRRQAFRDLFGNGSVRQCFGKDAHDSGFSCCQSQHPPASSTNEDGWMRSLDRFGKPIEVRNGVVRARECQWLVGEEALQDMESFFQAPHAYSWGIKQHPGLLILGSQPSCLFSYDTATT